MENNMDRLVIEKMLKKRIFANVIDIYTIFFPIVIMLNYNLLFVFLYLLFMIYIYHEYGYTLGGFIVGLKTYWQKEISYVIIIRRFFKSIFYNNIMQNIIGDFYVNSCCQYNYDKEFGTYVLPKKMKLEKLICNDNYIFNNFYNHFIWYILYNLLIIISMNLIQLIF